MAAATELRGDVAAAAREGATREEARPVVAAAATTAWHCRRQPTAAAAAMTTSCDVSDESGEERRTRRVVLQKQCKINNQDPASLSIVRVYLNFCSHIEIQRLHHYQLSTPNSLPLPPASELPAKLLLLLLLCHPRFAATTNWV